MKRAYFKPAINVINIDNQQLLSGSTESKGTTPEITIEDLLMGDPGSEGLND